MQAHRLETVLKEDGTLTLEGLPFRAGEPVEVIILLVREPAPPSAGRYPLHGTPIQYAEPFAPVAEDDWDAAR